MRHDILVRVSGPRSSWQSESQGTAYEDARSATIESLGLLSAVIFSLTFVILLVLLSGGTTISLVVAGLLLVAAPALPWLGFRRWIDRRLRKQLMEAQE